MTAPKRGRGRPPIGRPLNVTLDPDVRMHIDAMADAEGVSFAEAARRLLRAGIDATG